MARRWMTYGSISRQRGGGRVRVRAICRHVIDISLKSTIASLASHGFLEADVLVKGEPELFWGAAAYGRRNESALG